MAAFLANIGVNASHVARSRMSGDGSFMVLPIPERQHWAPPMRRLSDPDLEPLALAAPLKWWDKPVHLDPDFLSETPTYGDNCRRAGRAYSLRQARPGDQIWFLARLHREDGARLHLVGSLAVADVLRDVIADPGRGWWDRNAHVLRARAGGGWNSFWIFRGERQTSGWLRQAVPFGRAEAERLFGPWEWPAGASEQQVLAWHTRAVRRVPDQGPLNEIVARA